MTVRPPRTAADHITELTRPFTTVELVTQPTPSPDGRWRTTTRLHRVTNPPLLDQLANTVTGTQIGNEGGATGSAYGSKPAGRLDVLALLHRIDRQSRELAIEHGFETPDRTKTRGRHLPLRDRLARLSGVIGDKPHPLVRSWWATARILTQHDGPPYSPRIPCPQEDCERIGSLRVRLTERLAFCVECHTVWCDDNADPSMSFGRLAVWSTWATEHLDGPHHLVDDTSYDQVLGYHESYDTRLGYRVACPECDVERHAMGDRRHARIEAARAAKHAA